MSARALFFLTALGLSGPLWPATDTFTPSSTRTFTLTRSPTRTATPSMTATAMPTASCPGGVTAGNSAPFSTSITGNANMIYFVPFDAPQSGESSVLRVYVDLAGGGLARAALYIGPVSPGALISESGSQPLLTGWNSFALPAPVAISGGTRYWIAVMYSSNPTAVNREMVPGNCYFRAYTYSAFPVTAGASAAGYTWTGFTEICPALSPTASPSFSESPTFTISSTFTEVYSPTVTPSVTLTPTLSPSFSESPTYSLSPTISQSHTRSPTRTVSPTATPSTVPTASCPGGVTAGNSTVQPNSITGNSNMIYFVPFTAPQSGQSSVLKAYVNLAGGGSARAALYDGAVSPTSLIAESGSQVLFNGWNSFSLAGAIPITSGLKYWIGVMYSSDGTDVNRATVPGGCYFRNISYGAFPALAGASAAGYTWTGFTEICPLASPTVSPTESPTFSESPTQTLSGTATEIQSPTASPTFSETSSLTHSPTQSPTASSTEIQSPSSTPSLTETGTQTRTRTISPTETLSSSHSPSHTPGSTWTLSETQSASPTPSQSWTSSPSETESPSATSTLSETLSATESPIESLTLTPTLELSPSFSATLTPSVTIFPSLTASPSISLSPTGSESPSATQTQTPGTAASPTMSMSPTPSSSPTVTPLNFATFTRTPGAKGGSPRILKVVAVPNPQGGGTLNLAVELENDAHSIVLEAYSSGWTQVLKIELRGPFYAGWTRLSCSSSGLSNGLYYVVLKGRLASGESDHAAIARVYRLN